MPPAGPTTTPIQVKVDAHAQVTVALNRQAGPAPEVAYSVDPGPSGLGTFEASLDGVPMQITGADATFSTFADLGSAGAPTTTCHATDGAGNSRDGAWRLERRRHDAAVAHARRTDDGWSGEDRRPEVAFDVADAGIGIDAAACTSCSTGWKRRGGRDPGRGALLRSSRGRPWPPGSRHVEVTVADGYRAMPWRRPSGRSSRSPTRPRPCLLTRRRRTAPPVPMGRPP